MPTQRVDDREETTGLALLCSESNRSILQALRRSPSTEAELRGWLVLRANGKLRRHLEILSAASAIDRRPARGARRRFEYCLTPTGAALAQVMTSVDRWLMRHPERGLDALGPLGWRAFGLLIDSWVAGTIKLLARAPRNFDEIRSTTELTPARLHADLSAMKGAGIIMEATGADPAYALTEWGSLGVGVLALGSHRHREVAGASAPIVVGDALAALCAILPLGRTTDVRDGICTLTVEPAESDGRTHSGAVRVETWSGAARVVSAAPGQPAPDAWLRGTVDVWLDAVFGGRVGNLAVGGDRAFARKVLTAARLAISAF